MGDTLCGIGPGFSYKIYRRPDGSRVKAVFNEVGNHVEDVELGGESYIYNVQVEDEKSIRLAFFNFVLMEALDGKPVEQIAVSYLTELKTAVGGLDGLVWEDVEYLLGEMIDRLSS
jgi:hypothetical protein